MGKNEVHHQQQSGLDVDESGHFRQGCSIGRIVREFNFSFRCLLILIFSLSILLSGIFWILPRHSIRYGFDVKDAIKLRASVQVSFRLQKPVSQLVLHIPRLEYDINDEIGVPDTKVAILSMHHDNFVEFEQQLKSGLHLTSYENVFVQLTNKDGSTTSLPITVQASVVSADMGSLLPQRLRQLAETITGSPAENLGLDDSVFGEVKSVRLSSYLEGELHATTPTPSPAPSPEFNGFAERSSSPSYFPGLSPQIHGHIRSTPPFSSPPDPSVKCATPQFSPSSSPTPSVSYGPSPGSSASKRSNVASVISSPAPSPSSLAALAFCRKVWLLRFAGIMGFHLLCWLH